MPGLTNSMLSSMKQVGAKSVLVFLRLDHLLHCYTQREMGKHTNGAKGKVANPADHLSDIRIHSLTKDYFKRFYFSSTSKHQLLLDLPNGMNLYTRRTYDVIVNTGEENLAQQFEKVKLSLVP